MTLIIKGECKPSSAYKNKSGELSPEYKIESGKFQTRILILVNCGEYKCVYSCRSLAATHYFGHFNFINSPMPIGCSKFTKYRHKFKIVKFGIFLCTT